jgi:hypothetical protein
MLKATVGFRARSGWAVAVAVAKGAVIDRRRFELCDRLAVGSAQPYHAAARMPLPKAEAYLKRCAGLSAAMAEAEVRKLMADLAARGYRVAGCSILLASGHLSSDLAKTLASHPMIHTAEGEFYREAIREGCRRCGLRAGGIKERELCSRVTEAAVFGKALGPPWRSDEKLCCLAALCVE